jgi:hypothetical protein
MSELMKLIVTKNLVVFEGINMEYNARHRETTELVIKLISSYYILNFSAVKQNQFYK